MAAVATLSVLTWHTVFETEWGFFGLGGNDAGILRSCLPMDSKERARSHLLSGSDPIAEGCPWDELRDRICSYFAGDLVQFGRKARFNLVQMTLFSRAVLLVCGELPYGMTTTYRVLALRAGRPDAARAVGTIMARNPLPLLVPCHRVVRSDGQLGGFSAPGGPDTKRRMLQLESESRLR
ncbi:MAG: MGMT family protein [Planctomycetes bacterium]|nr:MGMT family protein [Planctomycetota bacterium]